MINFYRFSHFKNHHCLLHCVTTKSSLFPYHCSLALHTGENKQDIIKNRQKISENFSYKIPLNYIVADQTHSDNIHSITEHKTRGWKNKKDAIVNCDALITNKNHIMLTILTADCVPILLYDTEKKVIAAVHAGWKGTQKKIVRKTVLKMCHSFGCNPQNILADIAPSIGKCCYEVGKDVAEHFSHTRDAYTVIHDKYMLDLPQINKQQLLDVGLLLEHIEMSNICTACEVDTFFSYRKEKGCSGRFMSMIGLNV